MKQDNTARSESPRDEIVEAAQRNELNAILLRNFKPFMRKHPEINFSHMLLSRYGVGETRLLTLSQLRNLTYFVLAGLSEGERL